MIDTGAQPSVMDENTLYSLGLRCKPDPGIVRGVCATPIDTLGFVKVEIDLGNGRVREHTFTILDSPEPTVIWEGSSYCGSIFLRSIGGEGRYVWVNFG